MHHQYNPGKKLPTLLAIISMLLIASLACNVPIFSSEGESPPQPDSAPPQPTSLPTPRVDTERSTDGTGEDVSSSGETSEDAPPEPTDAPVVEPVEIEPIQAAQEPAVPDCNAFDVVTFNAIVEGTFNFITQDQLNNCHFESDNNFRLLVGGGKPLSSEEMHSQFNATFGAIPGSSWEVVENFYLGMSFSSASVSAQGVSASGHSIVIVAAAQPGADPEVLKGIFTELARESAIQLNQQW